MLRSRINHIFAVLAVLGLLLAPVARPSMATPTNAATHEMAGQMAAAAKDMPCCPDKPALPNCSKDCPFMALCGAMAIHDAAQNSLSIALIVAAVILPGDASMLVSVAPSPPRKPPKA